MKKHNKKLSWVFVLSLVGLVFSLTELVSADVGDGNFAGCWTGGMMGGNWGYGGMFFGWLFGILTVVALVLLIVWLVKQIQK